MNWTNILERAAWTFVQAFVGAFSLTVGTDLDALAASALSAAVAGASALLSFVKTVAQEQLASRGE